MNKINNFIFALILSTNAYGQNDGLNSLYFMPSTDLPAFWGNEIEIVGFPYTEDHEGVISNAISLAKIYANASEFPDNNDIDDLAKASLIYATSPNLIHADSPDPPFRSSEELLNFFPDELRSSPSWRALNNPEFRLSPAGTSGSLDCLIFFDGGVVSIDGLLAYRVSSVAIVANSDLDITDIYFCFQNRTSLAFGIFIDFYEHERQGLLSKIAPVYFTTVPLLIAEHRACQVVLPAEMRSCLVSRLSDFFDLLQG